MIKKKLTEKYRRELIWNSTSAETRNYLLPYPLNVLVQVLKFGGTAHSALSPQMYNEQGFKMLRHDILTEINMRRKIAYRTPLESFDIVERWFNDALNEMGDAKMWIKLKYEAYLRTKDIAELLNLTARNAQSAIGSRITNCLWNLESFRETLITKEPYEEEDVA